MSGKQSTQLELKLQQMGARFDLHYGWYLPKSGWYLGMTADTAIKRIKTADKKIKSTFVHEDLNLIRKQANALRQSNRLKGYRNPNGYIHPR